MAFPILFSLALCLVLLVSFQYEVCEEGPDGYRIGTGGRERVNDFIK